MQQERALEFKVFEEANDLAVPDQQIRPEILLRKIGMENCLDASRTARSVRAGASSPLSLVLDNGKGPRLRLRILIRSQPGMGVEDAPTHADDPEGLSTDQCIRSSTAHPRDPTVPPRNGKESGIRSAAPCPFRVECVHAAALLRKGTYIHTVQGHRAAAWRHEGGGKRGNARYSISHDACTPPRAWRPRRRDADSSRAPLQLMHLLLYTTRPCCSPVESKIEKKAERTWKGQGQATRASGSTLRHRPDSSGIVSLYTWPPGARVVLGKHFGGNWQHCVWWESHAEQKVRSLGQKVRIEQARRVWESSRVNYVRVIKMLEKNIEPVYVQMETSTLLLELEKEVFDTTTTLYPAMVTTLLRVAWRVKNWTEPFLYNVVSLTGYAGRQPTYASLISKDRNFLRNAVRHLCLDYVDYPIIISTCSRTFDLSWRLYMSQYPPDALSMLSVMPLERHAVDFRRLFPDVSGSLNRETTIPFHHQPYPFR
ncbi:hypothetical protein B0H14DRAFT_3750843 [Mycena olivaceomarginata]|nr:hypothetical protein B0H14DRAFT_3750843 [Mycena olivaceomarginata]